MPNTIWRPHPKQEEALRRIEFEVLFGGSRGPGKTDAGLVWLMEHINNPLYRALVIRKNADDLSDWVDRAARMYRLSGATIAYRPAEIRFPSGAAIKTGHLKDDQAYTKYQGHEYQRILIEELTQIPDEKRYLQLLSSCRSTVPGIKPQIFNTTNPGGIGHGWVKGRFVDPSPPGVPFRDKTSGRTRIFIFATLDDNPTLLDSDPDYVHFLDALRDTDVELWKAWRLGSWDTFAGQFFREFRRDLHVIDPILPRPDYVKIAGFDWGYSPRPFVFLGTVCIPQETENGTKFNRLVTFTEITGNEKIPEEWAKLIDKSVYLNEFSYVMGDPSAFHKTQDGSISIADQMKNYLGANAWKVKPANNDRVGGWSILHKWLSIAADGLPYWMITNNCVNLIAHLPTLVHDENRPDDLDTEGLDDEADAARYMLMHYKWIDSRAGGVKFRQLPTNRNRLVLTNREGKPLSINADKMAVNVKR